jgi:hypothetical protein
MSKEIHMTITKADARRRAEEDRAKAKDKPTDPNAPQQLRRGVSTFTQPGLREGTADAGAEIAKWTGPVQIIGGLALAPFTAGLSAGLIASGMLDGEARHYANSERQAAENRRLLDEAQKNKHKVEVKGGNGGLETDTGEKEVPLQPGYVEVLQHDPIKKTTQVKVLFDASLHTATHVVTTKK